MIATACPEYAFEAALAADPLFARFRALSVCEALDEEECMLLFSCFVVVHVAAEETLYEAQTLSDHTMRLILQGEVSVHRSSGEACGQLNAGDLFGLFSFLDEQRPHAATLRAMTDLKLLSINRAYFNLITLEDPALGQQMLRFMFRLLARMSLKLENEYAAISQYVRARGV